MVQERGALKSWIQKDAHARTLANKEKQREPQERGGNERGRQKETETKEVTEREGSQDRDMWGEQSGIETITPGHC